MAAERLSGLDTAFLCVEREVTPMHLGALAIFRSGRPVRPKRVATLLADRARRIPRLRRRVRSGWFPPGVATWADDPRFRAEEHIYLHQLDGHHADGDAPVAELVAELMARPLRRSRPLWEFHVLVGLAEGRFAVLVKLHHALGDGMAALEIGVGLLDPPGLGMAADPAVHRAAASNGRLPARTCSARAVSMACGMFRPLRLVRSARRTVRTAVGQAIDAVGMAVSVLRSARLPAPGSPLVILSSGRRGLGLARLDLAQVRRIRSRFGGTVNDVLLAVVAGALREWLQDRGHPVDGLRLRALIPVSQRARSAGRNAGNQMAGYLCELPLDEPDPGRRLRAIQEAMQHSKATGTRRGAGAIPLLADRLPPAVHRVAAPVAGQVAALLFDLLVTSVPLPGIPLRLDGAELAEVFPVPPLAPGHALGVALSCYRGTAYIGLYADREALPDVQGLADAVSASVAGLDRVCA